MFRSIIAVVVGFALWSALWLGGNALLFAKAADAAKAKTPITEMPTLLGLLALSVGCSAAAGLAVARIAVRGKTKVPVLITAILLLLVGVGVQSAAWSLMPVWYHAMFLGLLVPVTLIAGRR